MLGGGIYGLVSLSKASGALDHATGVIDKLSYKREYRHRKRRTHWEMRISYETERYIWFTLLSVGLLCMSGVWLMLRPQRQKERHA